MAETIRERASLTEVRSVLRRYWRALEELIRVDRLVLFGSHARGNPHHDSDIDVAVISGDLSGDDLKDARRLLSSRLKTDLRIEPHFFRPEDFHLDNPLAAEIIETGLTIPRPGSRR